MAQDKYMIKLPPKLSRSEDEKGGTYTVKSIYLNKGKFIPDIGELHE